MLSESYFALPNSMLKQCQYINKKRIHTNFLWHKFSEAWLCFWKISDFIIKGEKYAEFVSFIKCTFFVVNGHRN